jgi:myo-inositol-1(or 4)-monophosphatase
LYRPHPAGRARAARWKRALQSTMKTIDAFLKDLLLTAGERMKKHYGKVKTITFKAGASTNLVTNVDEDIENFVKRKISRAFPEDSILAEESDIVNADANRRWIIDPLDGTTNFAHGLPYFCISIGVESAGKVVAGGVYNPILDEFFFASLGKGATFNGKKISVSKVDKLENALLVTGFPYDIHWHPERSLPYFNALIQKSQGLRRLGSAAIDICYVAMGRCDGFFEVQLNAWDTAAAVLILTEAGGEVHDFSGEQFSIYRPSIVCSNGKIQKEMLQVIAGVNPERWKKVL